MPRLPLRLRQTGFLLGLIVACSDGPAPKPVTTDAFTAPENFTATVTSASEVELTWDPSPGTELEYRVRWRVRGESWAPAERQNPVNQSR